MTAAVATISTHALSQPDTTPSSLGSPAEARKRRREILASQRGLGGSPGPTLVDPSSPKTKKCKVDETESLLESSPPLLKKLKKKTQMKYDPEVPMTKEEAAVWRREQRRKRNRESAAASRQRQRDRITELEAELDDWKSKYAELMSQISTLENKNENQDVEEEDDEDIVTDVATSEEIVDNIFMSISCVSPTVPRTPIHCTADNVSTHEVSEESEESEEEEEPLPTKMISRPATSRIIHETPATEFEFFPVF